MATATQCSLVRLVSVTLKRMLTKNSAHQTAEKFFFLKWNPILSSRFAVEMIFLHRLYSTVCDSEHTFVKWIPLGWPHAAIDRWDDGVARRWQTRKNKIEKSIFEIFFVWVFFGFDDRKWISLSKSNDAEIIFVCHLGEAYDQWKWIAVCAKRNATGRIQLVFCCMK